MSGNMGDHEAPIVKSFPACKSNTPALNRSRTSFLNASNLNRRAVQVMWSEANKCPLFLQKRTQQRDEDNNLKLFPVDKNGQSITTRSNRALSSHTLKTMASGAAATIGAQMMDDSATLRTNTTPEDPKYPMLPTFTSGAAHSIEAAWIAYVQEILHIAVEIKNAVGKHKKVTAKCCQSAAEILNYKISRSTGFVPIQVPIRKLGNSKKAKRSVKVSKSAKGNAALISA